MARQVTSLPVNRGGTRFGQMHAKKVTVLARWVKVRESQNKVLEANLFTLADIDAMMAEIDINMDIQQEGTVLSPGKLMPLKWIL